MEGIHPPCETQPSVWIGAARDRENLSVGRTVLEFPIDPGAKAHKSLLFILKIELSWVLAGNLDNLLNSKYSRLDENLSE